MFDGRQPLKEEDLSFKTNFNLRQYLKNDCLKEKFQNSALPYAAVAVIFLSVLINVKQQTRTTRTITFNKN